MSGHIRLFSILSLLAVVAIAMLGGMSFRALAVENLTRLVEKSNESIAQGYVHTVWKTYREVIAPASGTDPAALKNNPQVTQFAQETVRYFQSVPWIRVNLYSAEGMLLMTANVSADNKLAGNTASPDVAFVTRQLQQPAPVSKILENVPLAAGARVALVQTVVPIRLATANGGPDGALEMVYDVSDQWQKLVDFQMYGTGGIIAVFLLFLAILFVTSRKSESIIARQHEANIELAAAAATAQAENREKSQFLANVSHELRTPLNAIIGFSDIIKNEVIAGSENQKYHDYINDIHSSGVHLLSLINDILDYSKAEAGKLEMEVGEVNATKLIQNSMRMVSPRAETAKVTLVENLPKEQMIMITDSKKFKQILLNLLSNAVKFTQGGGKVSVSAWRDIGDDTFSFEVRDTGIGIAPKDISRAMAPFGQVDSTLSRKYEGTGLGLPLTKKFVEIMGGKFMIESEVGTGTVITFTLPRELKAREGLILKQAS